MSKAIKKTQQLASQQAKDNVRKQIIKLYERKQYKKALKLADSILKVQPDHGEARSLKGLVLSATGQKDQALECAKLGLRNDLQSHVCWHVLGLVHRSVQEYTQSIKCYRGALRYDPENQQILRDLALLQIHVRDLDGYWETRRRLLQAKPTQKANWMALAIAEQLRGNLDTTLSILDGYGSLHVEEQDSRTPEGDYEFSEFTMFKASVLCEANKYQEAWNLISANENRITDFDALNTMKVDILLKLNKAPEAQAVAQRMVTINPDNLQSHTALQRTMSLLPDAAGNYTADQVAQLEQLYEHLAQELPRWCKAVRSVPLSFLPDGDKFLVKLEQYIKPALTKGVPALHSTLRPLYKDSAKIARIESLLRTYITSLRETGKFPGDEKLAPPSAIMWTMLVLAHHLNAVKRFEEALAIVNQGIEHTPTALELYMCKAKIYKSAGDIKRAAYEMNQVRLLDLADRFLNTKATKYFLRADQIKEAEEVVMLFTKQEDGLSNLFDMQCMWYELEYGASAIRRGESGMAIKKLLDVYKHFNTIVEDQLDYHTYCLRKMALRSYVAMLRLEDNIYSHPKILKALTSAVQSLLDLHDNPRHQAIPQPDTQDKKELAKWTREEKRRQTQEAAAAAAMTAEQREALAYEKLAAPLQEATKYVKVLLKFHPNELGAQVAAFELYLRKGKLLLALRAVNKLLALAPNSAEAHVSRIKLVAAFTKIAEPNATVAAIVQAEAKRILGADSGDLAKDMQTCADAYLAQAQSLAQRTAALHVLQLIGAGAPALQAAAAHVVAYTPSSTDTIYADYRAAHKAVAQVAPDEAARYLEQLKQTFPLHEFFSGVSSVPTQEEQTATATEAAATSSETNE